MERGPRYKVTALPGFDCSSKYFTRSAPGLDIQQLNPNIDPEGNLTSLINHQWVHTSDNIVVYKQLQKSSNDDIPSAHDSYSMNATNPSIFNIGDVVEASITFSAFRLQNKKSEAALIERMRSSYSVVQRFRNNPQLKRKNPFEEDCGGESTESTDDNSIVNDDHSLSEAHRAIRMRLL
ncbi:hypothetical protein CVT24_002914 [Panaeolus cyanescens]|uniref:Uncharacterized protein n=1 Tax=Panaeolus cyanescens TaxID=181874 RepID=A0A409XC22_9AGAR|nr:hypothetical protein CVT24_002914 [Panaeolus cyanescens]